MKRFAFNATPIVSMLSFIFICVSLLSCDILRNGIFEVSSWSPGEGYHDPALTNNIALDFSLEPDRNSAERAFSLSEEGRSIAGHFSWQANRMIFAPAVPLAVNKVYTIVLKTDAQDIKGLSLERQFEAVFTTRYGGGRPALLAAVPEDGTVMQAERGTVELLFSGPLDRDSLQNLSFSPAISGVWNLEDTQCRAVFTPSENWQNGRSYRLTIGAAVQSELEVEAGRGYMLHFVAGTDHEPPELLSASALDDTGADTMILTVAGESATENTGWERNFRLCLVFSEAVDTASVSSALSCEPSLGLILETEPGFSDTVVYRFNDAPVYNASYTISLRKTVRDMAGNTLETKDNTEANGNTEASLIWYIRADGENSRPPLLRGLRFPKTPGSSRSANDLITFTQELLFADFPVESGNYVFDRGVDTWIELYFETAPNASVDLLSLMDRFRFSATNGALSFSPRLMISPNEMISPYEMNNVSFSVGDPAPGWEDFCRVEIRGVLTNHPYTGMVTIEVGAGLRDSLGNKSAEALRFLLLK